MKSANKRMASPATVAVRQFCYRHPYIGPIIWVSCLQFFVVQYVVAANWSVPFSLRTNTISDLGVTSCGDFAGRLVCSPWFAWMNLSFVLLGIAMILGAFLLHYQLGKNALTKWGFVLMGIGGLGTVLVGVFPADVSSLMHAVGAILPFSLGNIGLLLLGLGLSLPTWLKRYSIASGVVALAAFVLFSLDIYLGLGEGGMERVIVYPQTIWLIIFGLYITYTINHGSSVG